LAAPQHHPSAGPGAGPPRHPPPQHWPGGRAEQRKHDLALTQKARPMSGSGARRRAVSRPKTGRLRKDAPCWIPTWTAARCLRLGQQFGPAIVPHGSAVGETVNYEGINYSVVGVLESTGTMPGGMQDNFAVIPITTGLTRYYRKEWITSASGAGAQPGGLRRHGGTGARHHAGLAPGSARPGR